MVKKNKFVLKFLSLLIHLRIQNLLVLVVGMYLSSAYLFSNKKSLFLIFYDVKLHIIIWGSLFSIAAGYLIKYFYDLEKNRVAQPFTFYFKSFIKINELLYLYLGFNIVSLFFGGIISYKLFLFFILYQFIIWIYCHKLSKILFINNLLSVFLSVFPFFGLLLHYGNINFLFIKLAIYIVILLFLKQISKDTYSISSDIIFNYRTLPNYYGIKISRINTFILFLILIALSVDLSLEKELFFMKYYFIVSSIIFIIPIIFIIKDFEKYAYNIEVFIKIWIFAGILSIIFVKYPINL